MFAIPSTWTPDRLNELRALILAGKTFEEISKIFGVTRNAVAGACNRNHIAHPVPPHAASEKARRKRERKMSVVQRKPPMQWRETAEFEAHGVDDSPARLVDFFDLEPHHCRWPIGDPPNYCGRRKTEESPYCAEHASIAMTKVRRD